MVSLFPDKYPEGFIYQPDFLSQQEEKELLELVESIQLHTFKFQGYEAKRQVASFGYDWSFEHRKLSAGRPIPEAFSPLIKKVSEFAAIDNQSVAELLITRYDPGTVINWHRDAPPFDIIIGISLLSDCDFRFRPRQVEKQSRTSILSLKVARRSIYILKDESRTDWQHSIRPVKNTRFSITLRTLH